MLTESLAHARADGEVGHVVVVHDVEVDNVSAGSDHVVDLLAELGEVGREDRRSDEEVLVHSGIPCLKAQVSGLGLVNESLLSTYPTPQGPGNVCWKAPKTHRKPSGSAGERTEDARGKTLDRRQRQHRQGSCYLLAQKPSTVSRDYLRPRQYCTDRAKYKRTNDTLRLRAASLLGKDVSVAAPK